MFNFFPYGTLFTVVLFINVTCLSVAEGDEFDLPQTIDYAINNNTDMQIMQERIGEAEAQLQVALSNFYPNLSTSITYQHSDNPSRAFGMIIAQRRLDFSPSVDFNHPGGTDNYRPEIRASYSLFRGGQDYFKSKAAQLGVDAAKLEESAARNQLIQVVSSTFYAYLAALEADKVAINSIQAVKNELKQSRIRYDEGVILRSDILSLEVQLAEAQDKKIQTANAIELTMIGLKNLLGLSVHEAFTIESSTQWTFPQIDHTFEELVTIATTQRPESQAAKKYIDIAQQQLNAAKGVYLPKADAYVAYGSDSKDLEFSTNRDNITAGVMVEMDIFSGFRDKAKIKKAEHQLMISKKVAQQTQLTIEKAVKIAYLKVIEALARIEVTSASVVAAEEALRLVNEQRKAGTVTVTRFIEAEVARDKSHARNIAARFDALRAETELNQSIGTWR